MRIAYFRTRPNDPPVAVQRDAMGGGFDREHEDGIVSDGLVAARRPGFAKLLGEARSGDSVHVFAIDRLGRDTIDVHSTVRRLVRAGVTIEVHGIGLIAGDAAAAVPAALAQLAELEYRRIVQRTEAARDAARRSFAASSPQDGDKGRPRRPMAADATAVLAWRCETGASIPETARHFGLKVTTVKRYGRLLAGVADLRDAAEARRASGSAG